MRDELGRPPSDLMNEIPFAGFDPTNPEHRSILSATLLQLSFCRETMAILLTRFGINLPEALSGHDIADHED